MYCKVCGGTMVGDGYMQLRHCEYASDEDTEGREPDAGPVYCRLETGDKNTTTVQLQDVIDLAVTLQSGGLLKPQQSMYPAIQT